MHFHFASGRRNQLQKSKSRNKMFASASGFAEKIRESGRQGRTDVVKAVEPLRELGAMQVAMSVALRFSSPPKYFVFLQVGEQARVRNSTSCWSRSRGPRGPRPVAESHCVTSTASLTYRQHSVSIDRPLEAEIKATLERCHAASLVYMRPLSKVVWPCGKDGFKHWCVRVHITSEHLSEDPTHALPSLPPAPLQELDRRGCQQTPIPCALR